MNRMETPEHGRAVTGRMNPTGIGVVTARTSRGNPDLWLPQFAWSITPPDVDRFAGRLSHAIF
jgi:hypothetical protein